MSEPNSTSVTSRSSTLGGGTALALLGGTIAGVLAFVVLVAVFEVSVKIAFAIFAGAITLIALSLVGNLRRSCLYLVLMFAPLGLRAAFHQEPHLGGAGAIFVDLVDPFLLALCCFQVRDWWRGNRRPYRFPPAATLWSAMIALGVVTVIVGPLRGTALNEVVRMLKLLVLCLVIVNEITRARQFRMAIVAITQGIILQSGIALAQRLLGHQLGLHFLGEATDEDIKALSEATLLTRDFVYRPDGLLGHSNLLAGFLALYLPMAIALLLAPVSRRLKLLLALAVVVGQPALVLTLSRTGWIDFSVAFLLVLALGALHPVSRRQFLFARLAIVVVTVAGALALLPVIMQRLSVSDPTAVEMRIEWLHTAWAMILHNPFFGTGLNSYFYAQIPYGADKTPDAMTDRYGPLWPAVHNSWALTWTEQGTIGFLLWIGVHVAVLAVAIRNLRIRDPLMHALAAGLLSGYVAIMIDGLTSFFVRTDAPGRLYWIAVGLILAMGYWRRNGELAAMPAAAESLPSQTPWLTHGARPGGKWLPRRESILR